MSGAARRGPTAVAPHWLTALFGQPTKKFLSQADCEALAERARGFAHGGGDTKLIANSWWAGELRWALNRVSLAADRRNNQLNVIRSIHGAGGGVDTNQIDDVSLEGAVREAERIAHYRATNPEELAELPPRSEYLKTAIWSEPTFGQPAGDRAAAAQHIVAPAEQAGMLSFGFLAVQAAGHAVIDPAVGHPLYAPYTAAQCSMTVRDPHGAGSGWAGLSSYDWARIDPQELARRALEKCLASRNPVTIEPGRYTVILEPQAVHDLVRFVVDAFWGRQEAEQAQSHLFHLRQMFSKIGLQLANGRVTIVQDPSDPDLGVVPFSDDGQPVGPATWIDHGLLTQLAYWRDYALAWLHEDASVVNRWDYRMSGGAATLDDMIRSTERGLVVTRFSNIDVLDYKSLLMTGVTRDGLWLVEHGRISKAVKNLRFTESPLFVLDSVDMLGPPERVFSPTAPAIVPPIKAHDFSFTATIDAI